jgi:hypothetical protein
MVNGEGGKHTAQGGIVLIEAVLRGVGGALLSLA